MIHVGGNTSRVSRRFCLAGALFVCCAALCAAREPAQLSPAEIEKRVETLLSKMTLDEKLTLIGGIDDFYIRPLPRLGLRALRMSDGPLGVHDYGPTTAYPAPIGPAASWDADFRAHEVIRVILTILAVIRAAYCTYLAPGNRRV
jgi:beta-glucosidase-like glycosyl hydrolase